MTVNFRDPTHLDPSKRYPVKEIAQYIREKMFGKDVREVLAQLAERFGNIEGDFETATALLTKDSEVIFARDSVKLGKFTTLDERLESIETLLGSLQDSLEELKNSGFTSGGDVNAGNESVSVNGNVITIRRNYTSAPTITVTTWEYGIGLSPLGNEPPGKFGGTDPQTVQATLKSWDGGKVVIQLPDGMDSFEYCDKLGDDRFLFLSGIKSLAVNFNGGSWTASEPDDNPDPGTTTNPDDSGGHTDPGDDGNPTNPDDHTGMSDKSALKSAIKLADGMNEADYTADGWKAMQDALSTAQAVDSDSKASQTNIDMAADALNAAIKALTNTGEPAEPTEQNVITIKRSLGFQPLPSAKSLDYALGIVPLGTEPAGMFGGSNVQDVGADVSNWTSESVSVAVYGDFSDYQFLHRLSNDDYAFVSGEHELILSFIGGDPVGNYDDASQAVIGDTEPVGGSGDPGAELIETAKTILIEAGAIRSAGTGEFKMEDDPDYFRTDYIDILPDVEYTVSPIRIVDVFYFDKDGNYIGWERATRIIAQGPSNAARMKLSGQMKYLEGATSITLTGVFPGEEVIAADKSNLESAISQAEGLTETDYTPESWSALQSSLDNANTVMADAAAVQKNVDEAASGLSNAISSLEKAAAVEPVQADLTALNEAVAKSGSLVQAEYTVESWNAMQSALSNANSIAGQSGVAQEAVDGAASALQQAVDALVKQETQTTTEPAAADKTALTGKITEALALVEADYTPESWNAFKAVLTASQTLSGDAAAAQEQVDNQAISLQQAIDGLVEKPAEPAADKSGLERIINLAAPYTEDAYTAESWAPFAAALDAAKAVDADATAAQQQVDDATESLTNTMNGLKKPVMWPSGEEIPEANPDAALTTRTIDLTEGGINKNFGGSINQSATRSTYFDVKANVGYEVKPQTASKETVFTVFYFGDDGTYLSNEVLDTRPYEFTAIENSAFARLMLEGNTLPNIKLICNES